MQYVMLGEVIQSAKSDRCGNDDYPVLSITKGEGIILQSNKFKKRIASQDTSQYKVVCRGQLVQGIHIDEANFGIQDIVDAGIVSPAYKVWNVDSSIINPKYLEEVLRSPRSIQYYAFNFNGSIKRRERLSDKDFLAMKIPCPLMEEQEHVLLVIQLLRNIILARKQEISKMDELIKARFVELFGDCRLNPKGWNTVPLGDIAEVGSSKRVFVEEIKEVGIPFYRGTEIGALAEGKKVIPELFITEEHYDELVKATGKPEPGDLLMPSICPDGRIWVVDTDKPFYFKDGRVLWIHGIDTRFDPVFLLYTLKDRIITDYGSIASGTTFAELKIFALKQCQVFDVPIEEQRSFAAFIAQIDKSKAQVQKSLNETQLLFDSLMQKYFG